MICARRKGWRKRARGLLGVAVAGVLIAAGSGCGEEVQRGVEQARTGVERLRADARERADRARDEFRERRERYGRRIREVLDELRPIFRRPERTSPRVRSRGRNGATTIDEFLTDLLQSIDRYWTRTLRAAGLPEPSVRFNWVEVGDIDLTGCGSLARDSSAFYCPGDDTIYFGQRFAVDLYRGVVHGLPGERAGYGRAAGDFAVAYVLAHEYAHNLQQDLGIFDNRRTPAAKPFELQADCMAGTWAYSVYAAGELQPGDIEEASDAALAVGDFDVGNEQHHGTPAERRAALLAGYRSGDPAACQRYLG